MITLPDPITVLADLPPPWREQGDLRVPTHCLYAGGGQVVVTVRPGRGGALVTDDGLGWDTLLGAGQTPGRQGALRLGKSVATRFGVRFADGACLLDGVPPPELSSAILHVANASQCWVAETLAMTGQRGERDLRQRAEAAVIGLYGRERVSFHERLLGASGKPHDIGIVIDGAGPAPGLVEPVANHPGALAATYVKFGDIGAAHPEWPREAVIEDLAAWRAEDVALLASVGTGVTDVGSGLRDLAARIAA